MNTIRKANIHDLNALQVLFEAYRQFYRMEPALNQARAFLSERISKEDSTIYISVNAQVANGFAQLYPLFSSTRMQPLWLLNDLYVKPEARGTGISKQLIAQCKLHCIETSACGLILETARTNEIGNKLYPQCGFHLDEDHYYYFWNA